MTWLIALAVIVVILVVAFTFPLAVVVGPSMEPTYHEGDILLCRRVYFKKHENYDSKVYVLKAPYSDEDEENRLIVKRVSFSIQEKEKCKAKYLFVVGDNPSASYDSRSYGMLHHSSVVAKVLFIVRRRTSNGKES